ncbi:protein MICRORCHIDIA 4-like, partial [Asparagus officinalis]
PLPLEDEADPPPPIAEVGPTRVPTVGEGSRQFWKAGDYDGSSIADSLPSNGIGMDHVRVHPKFLHSNATSHKWALGAFAELLDNALDEVCHGATTINVDVLQNRKDGTRMLLIEDNGGGMDPDKMRQCMSLGYSAKSKIANTIGQYGNGFKTSTMRLGADVIVFSRSHGKDGKSPTQSIGMLSYTFLRNTGKEDIVVPMLDYDKKGQAWHKMTRLSSVDWNINLETILQWSPYSSEADLLKQLNSMSDQGTRIVIYNLWEDDQGELELDFDTDEHDIQLGGVNRDEKKIEMARQFPNSRHFLTYRHSLRSYASILYLRVPHGFRMILRGKEVEHHNLVNDMMLKDTVSYRPQPGADGVLKSSDMVATVTMGFVKDAKHHVDVQGFNVYHKNRLIKPFWRVWNAAGSDGRGVIGVLEANFVEPAHDKQGFERTTVLSRLEARLIQMQKTYWSTKCHKIGYAPRRNKKQNDSDDRGSSPESPSVPSSRISGKNAYISYSIKTAKSSGLPFVSAKSGDHRRGSLPGSSSKKSRRYGSQLSDGSDPETEYIPTRRSITNESNRAKVFAKTSLQKDSAHPSLSGSPFSVNKEAEVHSCSDGVGSAQMGTRLQSKAILVTCNGNETGNGDSPLRIKQLTDENETLKKRIMKLEERIARELQQEREKNKLLTEQFEAAKKKLDEATKEQEALVDVFAEERIRRDKEEETLRNKLRDASITIQDLLEKLSSSRNKQKPS